MYQLGEEVAEAVAKIIRQDADHHASRVGQAGLLLPSLEEEISVEHLGKKLRALSSEQVRLGLPVDPSAIESSVSEGDDVRS